MSCPKCKTLKVNVAVLQGLSTIRASRKKLHNLLSQRRDTHVLKNRQNLSWNSTYLWYFEMSTPNDVRDIPSDWNVYLIIMSKLLNKSSQIPLTLRDWSVN